MKAIYSTERLVSFIRLQDVISHKTVIFTEVELGTKAALGPIKTSRQAMLGTHRKRSVKAEHKNRLNWINNLHRMTDERIT
jgi:hypothetical protein